MSKARPHNHPLRAVAHKYLATLVTTVIAIGILLLTFVGNFDIVRLDIQLLEHIEGTNIDDMLVAFLLIVVGMIVDQGRSNRRERQRRLIDEQRNRIFKATMRTVQDLVNNALTNLQLIRLEADARLPPETLALFDSIVDDTANQLKSLGDLEVLIERPMAIGTGIEFGNRISGR